MDGSDTPPTFAFNLRSTAVILGPPSYCYERPQACISGLRRPGKFDCTLFITRCGHNNFSYQMPVIDTDRLDSTAHTLYKAVSKANPEELDDIPTLRLTSTALDLGVVS